MSVIGLIEFTGGILFIILVWRSIWKFLKNHLDYEPDFDDLIFLAGITTGLTIVAMLMVFLIGLVFIAMVFPTAIG